MKDQSTYQNRNKAEVIVLSRPKRSGRAANDNRLANHARPPNRDTRLRGLSKAEVFTVVIGGTLGVYLLAWIGISALVGA